MSSGPRTQNEITEAVKRIPGIMKWLGQLDEKIKNLNVSTPVDNSAMETKIADLTKTFHNELNEVKTLLELTSKSADSSVEQIDNLFKKQEAKLAKQQKEFENGMAKSIVVMEQKIIDLSKLITNTTKTNTTKTNTTKNNRTISQSNNKGDNE